MPVFTAFDIVVFLLVVIGAVLGALRGFVTEVLSLLAWVAGILALKFFYTPVAALATGWVGSPSGGAVLAFALVFIVTFGLVRVLAGQLGGATRRSVVGPVDRFLGFGFGVVKGLILASLLFLGLTLAVDTVWAEDEPRPSWMEGSRTFPLLRVTSRMIVDFVEAQRDEGERVTPGAAGEEGYGRDARDALEDLIAPPKNN